MCPAPRAAIGSASRRAITIGARRLTASARSMSSTEKRRDVAAARQRRVGDQHVDVAGLGQQAVDVGRVGEVAGDGAPAGLGGERLEHVRRGGR